jgi:hypothetical protein
MIKTSFLAVLVVSLLAQAHLSHGQNFTFRNTNWETAETIINLSLKEENYYVLCLIEYWSKEHTVLAEETGKEDLLDPF